MINPNKIIQLQVLFKNGDSKSRLLDTHYRLIIKSLKTFYLIRAETYCTNFILLKVTQHDKITVIILRKCSSYLNSDNDLSSITQVFLSFSCYQNMSSYQFWLLHDLDSLFERRLQTFALWIPVFSFTDGWKTAKKNLVRSSVQIKKLVTLSICLFELITDGSENIWLTVYSVR